MMGEYGGEALRSRAESFLRSCVMIIVRQAYKKRLDKLPTTEGGAKAPGSDDMDPTSYGRAPKPDDKALNRLVDELAEREESEYIPSTYKKMIHTYIYIIYIHSAWHVHNLPSLDPFW